MNYFFKLQSFFFLMLLFSIESRAVNILQFTRSNSLTFEMLEDTRLPNSHVYNDYDMILTLGESWVQSPLVFKNPSNSTQVDEIIEEMYSTHLGFGVYATDTFFLGATTAYSRFKTIDNQTISGFTDIHLTARWRFLTRKLWAMSLIPQVGVPLKNGEYSVVNPNTNNSIGTSNFLSDDSAGVGVKLAYERLFSWGQVVTNIGYRHSPDAIFITNAITGDGIDMEQQLYTGLGAYIPITKKIGTNIEWARLWSLPFNNNLNPNEFYAGLSAGLTKNLVAFGGLSFGNPFSQDDGNDIRTSVGLKYVPKIWSKPRELYEPAENQDSVDHPHVKSNICSKKFIFGSTNTVVARFGHNFNVTSASPESVQSVIKTILERVDDVETIKVVGHTSTLGSNDYNLELSIQRAAAIKKIMINNGVPENIIQTEGRGEEQLLVNPEKSLKDQRQNRRTEFQVKLNSKYGSCY